MSMCPWWLAGCFYSVDMVLSECLLVARWLLTSYGCFPGCYYYCCYYVALWLLGCSKWFGLGGCYAVDKVFESVLLHYYVVTRVF